MARAISGSQYLELTSAVVSGPPFSVACWFYVTDLTSAHRIFDISASTGISYFSLHARGDQPGDAVQAIADDGSSGAGVASSSASYTANAWQHGAAVFTSTSSRAAFLNGANKGTDTLTRAPTGVNRTCVNRLYYSGSTFGGMSGRVAHLAIWDAALADAEVAALAAGFCPPLVRPASLVAYYPLGGFHGDYDRDLVGGYHLTPSGSPTFVDQPRIIYPSGPHGVQLASGGGGGPSVKYWLARQQSRIIGGGL